jgi:hypothetical protein
LALGPGNDEEPKAGFNVASIPASEPHHFIVPLLSRRRPLQYNESTRIEEAVTITTTKTTLAAKLARISSSSHPDNPVYSQACKEVLGFDVGVVASNNGQLPGRYLPEGGSVAIGQLGDGVLQIASFLADIVGSKGKLFLIEEPENDLHPAALKVLLGLIVTSSAASNQFVISTHSGIVLQYLGAESSCRIFQVASSSGKANHAATITRLADTPDTRIEVLRDLGYALSDFALWEGWLILEESSAERIIVDYLIPWFVQDLRGVRTVAAGGVNKVAPTLEDFKRLFLFAHLERVYAGRAWVCVDGDDAGQKIISELKSGYAKDWPVDHFLCFREEDFERYYPSVFADQVQSVLGIQDKQERRSKKRDLLNVVVRWLNEDQGRARSALQQSAHDVIDVLRKIASDLTKVTSPTVINI